MQLVKRIEKGSALTWQEMDYNLQYLDDKLGISGNTSYKVEMEVVGGTAATAFFTGTVIGMTTPVTITAAMNGAAGNSIKLDFNGMTTILAQIQIWNGNNLGNQCSVTDGDGNQVPGNKTSISLSGGDNGLPTTIILDHMLNSNFVRVSLMRNINGVIDYYLLYYPDVSNTYFLSIDGLIKISTSHFFDNYVNVQHNTGFPVGTYTFLVENLK